MKKNPTPAKTGMVRQCPNYGFTMDRKTVPIYKYVYCVYYVNDTGCVDLLVVDPDAFRTLKPEMTEEEFSFLKLKFHEA